MLVRCHGDSVMLFAAMDTGVILEVEVSTVGALPGLALAHHDSGHDLLPELGLSLLDGGHDHVTNTSGGETVQAGSDTGDGDDVEVASTGVVAAVHDGSAVERNCNQPQFLPAIFASRVAARPAHPNPPFHLRHIGSPFEIRSSSYGSRVEMCAGGFAAFWCLGARARDGRGGR